MGSTASIANKNMVSNRLAASCRLRRYMGKPCNYTLHSWDATELSSFQLTKLVLGCFDPEMRCCVQQPDFRNNVPHFLCLNCVARLPVLREPDHGALGVCHTVAETTCCSFSLLEHIVLATNLSASAQHVLNVSHARGFECLSQVLGTAVNF